MSTTNQRVCVCNKPRGLCLQQAIGSMSTTNQRVYVDNKQRGICLQQAIGYRSTTNQRVYHMSTDCWGLEPPPVFLLRYNGGWRLLQGPCWTSSRPGCEQETTRMASWMRQPLPLCSKRFLRDWSTSTTMDKFTGSLYLVFSQV